MDWFKENKVIFSIFVIFCLVAAFGIIVAISQLVALFNPTYSEVTEKIYISSLQDSSEIQGNSTSILFVESGTIKQEQFYRVMLTDGLKKRYYKLEAESTDIYEIDSTAKPYIEVEWRVAKVKGKVLQSFVTDTSLNGFSDVIGQISKISVYVPTGTIDHSFAIDLND